jgi:hypothetical protein
MKKVNYFKFYDNVLYHVRGHAVLLESGAETKNLIADNCIVDIRMGCSLLDSDHYPSGIYVTNPDN